MREPEQALATGERLVFPEFSAGWVWLAGAGPGDPTLITLQLWDALTKTDLVVYDFLVSRPILDLIPPRVERLYAGKRGGKPSASQRDITETLIAQARKGRRVLRLKGGDPFIFGRGGEEALSLVAAGVPFRVLPGLSSAPSAAAYAGIPLTHRDCNSSVTFVTGHDMGGGLPRALDWQALARSAEVLVFYMALRQVGRICDKLVDCGRSPEEEVAFIRNATLEDERVHTTTLAKAEGVARQLTPPVIFIVGRVVSLRGLLNWRRGERAHDLEGEKA